MKKELIFYYIGILVFFIVLIFSVRHIVNTTRIFVGYEDGFNPIHIQWNIDHKDSTLRVKDPMYLRNDYYLIDYDDKSILKNDTVLYAELFGDSLVSKGNALNVEPPYFLWKDAKNDTLKIFKHNITLKFTKQKY
ncbi:hypothetical protein [Empedobacter tilapiae]|uniref:Uncharacterized protein n=1 Tax=Empedobacter tilapiae TaxID=2491114 RepID=A0A4Z1BBS5_9FLAO|nr:hypothetical protein [Empedobacter tilapiae]TGN29156.1 hypothetical protein E4J94_04160 [Empedobacter tilapiae]